MDINELNKRALEAIANHESPLLETKGAGELSPLVELINQLIKNNRILHADHKEANEYIRRKIDQLLNVIGTIPLRPEELDNHTLINLDPIGIIAESFSQILEHLRDTNTELELAAEEIRAIFEAVGGGILVLDRNKQILSCNHEFEKIFSTPGQNLLGKTCHETICKDTKTDDNCPFDEMMKKGGTFAAPCFTLNDRSYNLIVSPVRDSRGDILRAVLLFFDITELITAKDDVVEEKERLALTLGSIAEGVVATDINGYVTLMNEVAEKLTGWSSKDALGKPVCKVINIFDAKEKISCSDFFSNFLRKEGKIERIGDTVLKARNSIDRLITISVAPIHRHDKSVTGAIMVFRDITKEKKMEAEIFKAKRIDSLGILAGGIAHDFNNLMTSILGNISLAKMHLEDGSRSYSHLIEAEKTSLRTKNLTRQLLTFSKGGAPITALTSTRKLIIESAEFALSGANIKIASCISDDLWDVEVDEGQISQVIHNLILNAGQAMPTGGTVEITAVNINTNQKGFLPLKRGNYIKVAIKDHGHGIEKEYIDKIFDPYYTTKAGGHGLGLAICYSIIKNHHGFISAHSGPGLGATFTFYLPAASARAEKNKDSHKEKITAYGRVLVLDDEEIVRNVINQMLTHFGHEIVESSDGSEAIGLYMDSKKAGRPFDVVIMDLTIPGGMGGYETLKKLLEIDPHVKAIASSGYANDPVMADYKKHGFKAVAPKPYDMHHLNDVLMSVLIGNNPS